MRKLLILGAGGYGKTVADVAQQLGYYDKIAFLDDAKASQPGILGNCGEVYSFADNNTEVYPAFGNNGVRMQWLNRLLEALHIDSYTPTEQVLTEDLEEILAGVLDYACENGLCEDNITARDIFDTRIMGAVTPMPREIIHAFGILKKAAAMANQMLLPEKMTGAKRRAIYADVKEMFSDYTVFVGGSSSFDMTPKPFNKYYALDLYCKENGLEHSEVVYIGDDYGLGGNDESVYKTVIDVFYKPAA